MVSKLSNYYYQVLCRIEKAKGLISPAKRQLYKDFRKHKTAFYQQRWQEAARVIGAEIEDVGYDFWRITRGGKSTFVHLSDVMLDDHISLRIAGNKPLTYRLMQEHGQRTPRYLEYTLNQLDKAKEFLLALGKPAVVKPARDTGAGQGITTNINNYHDLRRASFLAAGVNWNLIIEEQFPGNSYRLLYLDGKFIDAIQRDPPSVTGNSKDNLSQLITQENANRLIPGQFSAFSPIIADMECKQYLQSKGRELTYVPPQGEQVILKTVINQNSSRQNHVIRDQIHPSVIQVCGEAASILGLKLAGIDILAPTLTEPLEESGGIIGEINTTPGLHHHYLVSDKSKALPVTEIILDYIFSSMSKHSQSN